jgi:hypothetical protein
VKELPMTFTREPSTAWTVDGLRHVFSPAAQQEMAQYIRGPAAGIPVEQLKPEPQRYRAFANETREILLKLEEQPGAVLTAPVLDLAHHEVRALTWIVATLLGDPLVQNAEGNRLVHVYDRDRTKRMAEGARYHQTREGGSIHTDNVNVPDQWDFLVFSCIEPAMIGGETILVPAARVLDHLHSHCPEVVDILASDFWFEYRGIADKLYRAPVLRIDERGQAAFRYLRLYLEAAHAKADQPLNERQMWALDVLDSVLDLSELQMRFPLRAGEILLSKDARVLHGRTCFADYFEAEPLPEDGAATRVRIRRTMDRLWIRRA